MITTLLTIAASVLGGGGVWGLLIKAGSWLGWRWIGSATSLPLLGPLSHLATQLIDLVFWALRGLIVWLAGGANYISKSVPAAVLVLLITTAAWKFGPGEWRFWSPTGAPAISQPAPRTSGNKATARPAPARCSDPLSACWWDNLFQ